MANPTRFPAGISTFPNQHVMNTFPIVPNNYQIIKSDDFLPYRSTDYTVTTTGTGAITAFPYNGGCVQFTNGATAASTIGLSLGASGNQTTTYQFIPGNQLWFDTKVCTGGAASTGVVVATNSTIYVGLFDNATAPASSKYGAYFVKPSGGSTWNFVLVNTVGANTYTTTFTNVADTNNPSGVYGDANASNATLSLAGAAGYYTTVSSITTPGAGYKYAPNILATGSTGAGAQFYAMHGATASPISTGGSGVSNLYIANQGNGAYATYTAAVLPWVNLQFYYDGKGTIRLGVNGTQVCEIGFQGQTVATFNGTNANATNQSYTTTAVTAAGFPSTSYVSGFYPGDAFAILPKSQMQWAVFMNSATTASQLFWVDEFNIGTEFN